LAETITSDQLFTEISHSDQIIIDVRSPAEYNHAHIPGAFSIPLLDDAERKEIGITFKTQGREAAIVKGFDLTGKKFGDIIRDTIHISRSKNVLIYCWRGGLRSNIMSWILSIAGFRVSVLHGGYKSFRNRALNQFDIEKKIIVIGGKTGCGKSYLLQELRKAGEQIIDLENLAHHKGSAFGALGQPTQPGNEMFENLLAFELAKTDDDKIVWVENESRLIGKCALPDSFFKQLRTAPVIELNLDRTIRKKRILQEYGIFPVGLLKEKTASVKKRLGGLRLKQALNYLDEQNLDQWCELMIDYYDQTYQFSNNRRDDSKVHQVYFETDEMEKNVREVMNLSKKKFVSHFQL